MTPKRKAAQEYILKYIDKIAPGGQNKKLYADLFSNMTDKDFDKLMVGLRDEKITLSVIAPHDDSVKISVKNNFNVAKEIGYDFFQRLELVDPDTGTKHLTPTRFLVYRLPVRRTAQLLTKGISIPKNTRKIDMLSGQVTGESRASKITMPETQMLAAMGLTHTLMELHKYRGGDLGAKNAVANILYKQGRVDAATLNEYSTGVVSSKTLNTYFLGAHIKPDGLVR